MSMYQVHHPDGKVLVYGFCNKTQTQRATFYGYVFKMETGKRTAGDPNGLDNIKLHELIVEEGFENMVPERHRDLIMKDIGF